MAGFDKIDKPDPKRVSSRSTEPNKPNLKGQPIPPPKGRAVHRLASKGNEPKRSDASRKTQGSSIVSGVTRWIANMGEKIFQQQVNWKIVGIVVVALAFLTAGGFGVVSLLTSKNAQAVYVDGNIAGIYKIEKGKFYTTEEVHNLVVTKLQAEVGVPILTKEKITVETVHAAKKEITGTQDYILEQVRGLLTYQVEASAILVDGSELAVVKTEAIANEIFTAIKSDYYQEGLAIEEPEFVENVTVAKKFVDEKEIMTEEKAMSILASSSQTEKTYSVQKGDVLGTIASSADMTIDELLAINPTYTRQSVLRVGDVFTLVVPKPTLSVKTKEKVTYVTVIPKPVEVQKSNQHAKSYSKIIQQGKEGQAEVTEYIIRVNGFEEGREPIGQKVLLEPVTEIRVEGTK